MKYNFEHIASLIKAQFPNQEFIPLHSPVFNGNERKYVLDTIESTYVSSVGAYVDRLEQMMCELTEAKHAIAIVNGTNALHLALLLAGVTSDDEVIGQSLTFIATYNALSYIGAEPIFVDVDKDTLGLSPQSLQTFLLKQTKKSADGYTYNKTTGKRIKACVPMHTFGLPCRIDEIEQICHEWNITLVEDAAESIGSYYKGIHTGRFGQLGIFSFNGNKTITSGGGGIIITDDAVLAKRAKHLSTQAKVPHKWEFVHDEIGYNYRMPNINAALACAQLEQLPQFIKNKRELSAYYKDVFEKIELKYCTEIKDAKANYWLNAILLTDRTERDAFLAYLNNHGIMSRPAWELMHRLSMFKHAQRNDLKNSEWLADRLVNIPSSIRTFKS